MDDDISALHYLIGASLGFVIGLFVSHIVMNNGGGIHVDHNYGWECVHSTIHNSKPVCVEYKRKLD